jgi:hypothetical protein
MSTPTPPTINIPPTGTEGTPYTVTITDKDGNPISMQYITIELWNSDGDLVIINQADNSSIVSILLKRSDQSLKGTNKVVVVCADQSGEEYSSEDDSVVIS